MEEESARMERMSSREEESARMERMSSREEESARMERMRAARRRKIIENAKTRMERVCKLQQGFRVKDRQTREGDEKKVEDGLKVTEGCKERQREPSPVEDPPDELVVASQLPRPPLIQPVTSSEPHPPSILCRWTALAGGIVHIRLLLAMLAGVAVSLVHIAMGYNIPCFLILVTSELCFLLCILVSAMTTRDCPSSSQCAGTIAMLKVTIAILYPPAAVMVDYIQLVTRIVGIACQDLCVAVFSLVVVTGLLSSFLTP